MALLEGDPHKKLAGLLNIMPDFALKEEDPSIFVLHCAAGAHKILHTAKGGQQHNFMGAPLLIKSPVQNKCTLP